MKSTSKRSRIARFLRAWTVWCPPLLIVPFAAWQTWLIFTETLPSFLRSPPNTEQAAWSLAWYGSVGLLVALGGTLVALRPRRGSLLGVTLVAGAEVAHLSRWLWGAWRTSQQDPRVWTPVSFDWPSAQFVAVILVLAVLALPAAFLEHRKSQALSRSERMARRIAATLVILIFAGAAIPVGLTTREAIKFERLYTSIAFPFTRAVWSKSPEHLRPWFETIEQRDAFYSGVPQTRREEEPVSWSCSLREDARALDFTIPMTETNLEASLELQADTWLVSTWRFSPTGLDEANQRFETAWSSGDRQAIGALVCHWLWHSIQSKLDDAGWSLDGGTPPPSLSTPINSVYDEEWRRTIVRYALEDQTLVVEWEESPLGALRIADLALREPRDGER